MARQKLFWEQRRKETRDTGFQRIKQKIDFFAKKMKQFGDILTQKVLRNQEEAFKSLFLQKLSMRSKEPIDKVILKEGWAFIGVNRVNHRYII